MFRAARFLAAAVLIASGPASAQSAELRNGDFETPGKNGAPASWSIRSFSVTLVEDNPFAGKRCALIEKNATETAPSQFGNVMQAVDAERLRGKRVKLTGHVRVEGKGPNDAAAMWMRVDRASGEKGFFDNMGNRQIRDPKWKPYVIAGNVDGDAVKIVVGVMVFGEARAWIDAMTLEPIGDAVIADQPPRPLSDAGLRNLVALTRLLGYVRFFHPSDETKDLDWEAFAIRGVDEVEGAASPEALATALRNAFGPVAPGVQIWAGDPKGGPREAPAPDAAKAGKIVFFEHHGAGLGGGLKSIYQSNRVALPRAEATGAESRPVPGTARVKDLGGGVWCRVPIALFRDDQGTLPRAAKAAKPHAVSSRPEGWTPSGNDRATRIAGVMLAWPVFQHFYPYFDVVECDWNEALRAALGRAAADPSERAFLDTLRELVARLHDGHGNVGHASAAPASVLAVELAWVGDDLVVERVLDGSSDAMRGDVVVAIDGRPVGEHVARESRLISAATDGWRRYRLLISLRIMATPDPCPLKVRAPGGAERLAKVARSAPRPPDPAENAPKNGDEIAPGVVYFSLNGTDEKDLEPVLAKLAAAKSIVFDLRGYPGGAGKEIIRHLTKETITSAQWRVPLVHLPDREDFDCPLRPGWVVAPKEPYLGGKAAFITDGRAISYAESCLGIIEHYKLAAIVGERTAGTNGNVNPFTLPGGYSISWTGMRVLKHDGSQHHGVGIRPTVPCSRTVQGIADGRDELLEKAIETVR